MEISPNRAGKRDALRVSVPSATIVFLLISMLLVLFSTTITWRKVILTVDGQSQTLTTFSADVAGVLRDAGVELRKADILSHDPSEKVSRGMEIEVKKAFPVTVTVNGTQELFWLAEGTVSDLLTELDITLETLDRVEPEPTSRLKAGDEVHVIRVLKELITQRTEIPFREIRRGNSNLDRGESRVIQRGVTGLREDSVETIYENEQEVSTRLVQSVMVRPKQDRIVEYGENTVLSRGGRTLHFNRVITVTATAYCPGTEMSGCPIDERGHSKCTGHFNDGITASGLRAVAGNGQENNPHLVAVDRKVIPLGSKLYLDGYGFAVAADVGSAIVGNRIDLLLESHEKAWNFGRKPIRVYLLP